MKKEILAALLVTLVLFSCSVSTSKFPEPSKLKLAIANSIRNPFPESDTIIYESLIGICGNSSDEEMNRYYEPHLNEQPYSLVLSKSISSTVLFTGDSLYNAMNSSYKNLPDSITPWGLFSKNKTYLSVNGQAITNYSVNINEFYSYNEEKYRVEKLFEYNGKGWIFKVVDSTPRITKQTWNLPYNQ